MNEKYNFDVEIQILGVIYFVINFAWYLSSPSSVILLQFDQPWLGFYFSKQLF